MINTSRHVGAARGPAALAFESNTAQPPCAAEHDGLGRWRRETYRENLRQAAAAGNPLQLPGELQTYHSLHAATVIAHRQAQEAKQGELQRLENAATQARALLTNALSGSTAHAITERKQLAATAVVQARQQKTSTTNWLHEARDSYVKARVCNGMVGKRGG